MFKRQSPTTEGATAKYITKRVQSKDPVNEIRVFVDMIKTTGNEVNIYVKDKPNSVSLILIHYRIRNSPDEKNSSQEIQNDIITEEFRINNLDSDSFAIKLTMKGTDRLNVPRIKDIRIVGLGNV